MSIIEAIESKKLAYLNVTPETLEWTQAYGCARVWGQEDELIPVFGVHRFIQEFLAKPITQEQIESAAALANEYFPREFWESILEQGGYLPVKITALPEGSLVKAGEPIYLIESTDTNYPMLPSMVDKLLLACVWHDSTIALKTARARRLLSWYGEKTSLYPFMADYKAGSGGDLGTAHATGILQSILGMAFPGCLTTKAARQLTNMYRTEKFMVEFDVVQDHACVLAHVGNEEALIRKTLDAYPHRWCHFMLDTYNYEYVLNELVGKKFKSEIANRSHAVSMAIDSTNIERDFFLVRDMLEETFGHTVNEKGYKSFAAPIILSQSEDLSIDQLKRLIYRLEQEKWSLDSFFFVLSDDYFQTGLQRAELGFIQKICAVKHSGKTTGVCKNPKHDAGKKTLSGVQSIDGLVMYENGMLNLEKYRVVSHRFKCKCEEVSL
ncbi:putative Nicotinamide phosphoribosyltransferase [Vibrio coralliirubri]|uniref:nicotinamide phosphoribosyltransferase domain-containing protein n=1 Tax=Vibrio coralliirubri TaxID=1516159 RepID=UPI000638C0C5|nr:nicotinamide phosphoribosyltransferase domain-containing protein [Vibrio coralliirubri]CDT54107.1 putative Nicotinamide phosphoribosyltransferase [Vibrio coralliirubri]